MKMKAQAIAPWLRATLALALAVVVAGCKEQPTVGVEAAAAAGAPAATAGAPAAADPADWCAGHAIPESMCTKCNPELVDKFRASGDWCASHGYPESACPQCNPMEPPSREGGGTSSATAIDWCAEHELPESMCTKCHPELVDRYQMYGDWCETHGFPESACPQCHPMQPPVATAGAGGVPDWCGGHALPESKCTKCNPELTAQFQAAGDWCAEHEYPESACPICNPQQPPAGALGALADWCVEHGLPESKCTKCNRALVSQYQQSGDWCAEHGFPESVCPVCNPQAPPAGAERAAIEARTVRLEPLELEAAAGITTVRAQRDSAADSVECTARVAFDADKLADVRAIVPGIVREVHVELGARVEQGAPLFDLQSARIGEIQASLQTARQRVRTARSNWKRQRSLRDSQIASARKVEVAEQELATAKAEVQADETALELAGASPSGPPGAYTLNAPISGTVVRRPAVVGSLATAELSLATIADTSTMWVLCDVPEIYASRIAVGQPAVVNVDGAGGDSIRGAVAWVASEVDPRSRTVTARVEVDNSQGRLRANQFARAQIRVGAAYGAVSVPRDALQRVGAHEVVFVRASEGVYQPRVVERRGGIDPVLVEGAVREGDAVATTGAVLLRTEIMPGSIGAGCCESDLRGAD